MRREMMMAAVGIGLVGASAVSGVSVRTGPISGGDFSIPWSTFSSGGGESASGGAFVVRDSIGQGVDGGAVVSGGVFEVRPGYRGGDFVPVDCPGDATGDGAVTALDISAVLSNFGSSGAMGPGDGDVNGDGVVTALDISVVLSNFGTVCG